MNCIHALKPSLQADNWHMIVCISKCNHSWIIINFFSSQCICRININILEIATQKLSIEIVCLHHTENEPIDCGLMYWREGKRSAMSALDLYIFAFEIDLVCNIYIAMKLIYHYHQFDCQPKRLNYD